MNIKERDTQGRRGDDQDNEERERERIDRLAVLVVVMDIQLNWIEEREDVEKIFPRQETTSSPSTASPPPFAPS